MTPPAATRKPGRSTTREAVQRTWCFYQRFIDRHRGRITFHDSEHSRFSRWRILKQRLGHQGVLIQGVCELLQRGCGTAAWIGQHPPNLLLGVEQSLVILGHQAPILIGAILVGKGSCERQGLKESARRWVAPVLPGSAPATLKV